MCFKTHKHSHPHARQWPIAQEKVYKVHMDLIGPLLTSADGRRYIAVITDNLTRHVFTVALTDKSVKSIAIALKHFIALFGCPAELITDQGTEFLNQVMKDVSHSYNIKQVNIKTYRPSANGVGESKCMVQNCADSYFQHFVESVIEGHPLFSCLCTRSTHALWRPIVSSETYLQY